jgi:hypothetical protein
MTSIQQVFEPIASKAKKYVDKVGQDLGDINSLIPHQLHLDVPQIRKMALGQGFKIHHLQMGRSKGGSVLHLLPHNAHKMLNAYHEGKATMMKLSPLEIHASFTGGSLLGSLYNGAKQVVHHAAEAGQHIGHFVGEALKDPVVNELAQELVANGATAVGTAVGAYTGNPALGAKVGSVAGAYGKKYIKSKIPNRLKHLESSYEDEAVEAEDDAIHHIPKQYRRVAEQALYDHYPKQVREIERAERHSSKHPPFFDYLEEDYSDVMRRHIPKYSSPYLEPEDHTGRNAYTSHAGRGRGRPRKSRSESPKNKSHDSIKGMGAKKGSPEMKARMAKLRAMRGKGKGTQNQFGGDLASDVRGGLDSARSYLGLGFGLRHHHHMRGGDAVTDFFNNAGNTIKSGFEDAGNQIQGGFNDKIVNPLTDVGNKIVSGSQGVINDISPVFVGASKQVQDFFEDPDNQAKAVQLGKQIASILIHQGLPMAGKYAGGALADAIATGMIAPELMPVAHMLGSQGGEMAGEQLAQLIGDKTGYGIRRRGRPRKGKGAENSAPFKLAVKNNFGFNATSSHIANAPSSAFSHNPRVTRPSTEMTLSPYQHPNSPAMNPFIPQTYTQEGGTSCGYGGRGVSHTSRGGLVGMSRAKSQGMGFT